jgi:hypothetical protein
VGAVCLFAGYAETLAVASSDLCPSSFNESANATIVSTCVQTVLLCPNITSTDCSASGLPQLQTVVVGGRTAVAVGQDAPLSARFGLATGSTFVAEVSPVRTPGSNISAVREWLTAGSLFDSIAVLDVDDPSKPVSAYKDRWLLATSRPYLQLDPFWLAAFSAGVVVPRTKTFTLRVLTGSCAARLSAQAISDYGSESAPNPTTLGPLSSQLYQYAEVGSNEVLALRTRANTFTFTQTGPDATVYNVDKIQLTDNIELIIAIAISFLLSALIGGFG